MFRQWLIPGIAIALIVLAACSDSGGSQPAASLPTAVLSTGELQRWRADATDVAESYWGSWPDDTAILQRLADDVVFHDPSDNDFRVGSATKAMLRQFISGFADAEPSVEAIFLATDAAAYDVRFPSVLWPPWTAEPLEHPPFVILDVFRFRDAAITDYEVWFGDETLEMTDFGCFVIEGCPEAQAIIDRYIAAWGSRDRDQIAALYADHAAFSDSLLGIEAVGPTAISGLADERFGSGDVTVDVLDVYAQTNGYRAPTEARPELGRVIGVGIHYRISTRDNGSPILESLTTFELGTRQPDGFDRHPNGLITREEVFHDPDTVADLAP